MSLSEFDLIRNYFSTPTLNSARDDVLLGIGDDAALLQPPPGKIIATSVDTLLADVHFPAQAPARWVAHRALATNLSDLAAMGAEPAWFTLALTVPDANADWLAEFSAGLSELAGQFQLALIGGDTTRGPLSITIQVHGLLESGTGLRRDGAQPGDDIYVTGTLGDAAAGLQQIQADQSQLEQRLEQAFYQPQPRVKCGRRLVELASAAIDISDGLLADLGHILTLSQVAASINQDAIPLSPELLAVVGPESALELALNGGDDYELCFCAPDEQRQAIASLADELQLPISRVGVIASAGGDSDQRLALLDSQGQVQHHQITGYQHFD